MALPLAQLEGKYEILHKLSEGGMGAIYKVRHLLLDEVRVIKVMKPQHADNEELEQRFIREARNAIKLRHPNIAQLYDFSIDETGSRFIVMEYIDGLSLQELLKRYGRAPLGLALEIATQSLTSLDYLHRRGFVHRDISPDNLMVMVDFEDKPQVKLIDLGIAKSQEREGTLTQADTFMGKIKYASPESLKHGSAKVDNRGDLYSFGIVLYELVTGMFPIDGHDLSSFMTGHLLRPAIGFDRSDPEGQVPEGVRAAVLRALEKEPQDRIQTAREFSRLLEAERPRLGSVDHEFLARAIAQRAEPQVGAKQSPGTTQSELDHHFPPVGTGHDSPIVGDLLTGARGALAHGDFVLAKQTLQRVLEIDPTSPPALELQTKLEDAQRRAREEEERVASAIARVEGMLAEGRLGEARAALSEVAASQDGRVVALRGRLETALEDQRRHAAEEQRRAEDERQHRLVESCQKIAALLDGRQWEAARDALKEAQAEFGANPHLYKLWDDFARLEQADRDERFAQSLADAERGLQVGDLTAVIRSLEEAIQLEPTDPAPGVRMLESARAARAQRMLEQEREQELQAVCREIEERLDSFDLEGARARLVAASKGFGAEDRLLALGSALEETAAAIVAAQEAVGRAPALLEAERFDEARAELAQARRAARLPPRLAEQLGTLTRELEERERTRRLEQAISGTREVLGQLLGQGDLGRARQTLEAAERDYGREPFGELRSRLEQAEQQARREKCEALLERGLEAGQRGRLEEAVQALEQACATDPSYAEAARALALARRALEEAQAARLRAERLAAGRVEVERLRARRKHRKALGRLAELERSLGAAAELGELRGAIESELASAPPAVLPVRRLAGGAALILVAGVAAWLLLGRQPDGTGEAGSEESTDAVTSVDGSSDVAPGTTSPDTALPGVTTGSVFIDATPWARIVAVVDARGKAVFERPETYTPFHLTLPPGLYQIQLEASSGVKRTVNMTVVAGRGVRRVESFGRVNEDEFFRSLDW